MRSNGFRVRIFDAPRNDSLTPVIARSTSDEAIQCVTVLGRFALLAMTSKKASLPDRRFHEPTRVAKKLAQRLVAIGGFNRRRFPVRPLSHGERGYGLS